MKHFLSPGNIISTTGLDMMQISGYTIVVELLKILRSLSVGPSRSVFSGDEDDCCA